MQLHWAFSRLLSWGLSLFFKLLYHPLAWTYDWVAAIVSLGRWKTWVLSVVPDLRGPRVLELGHGPGHLQLALARHQITPFGLDQSRQMGRIARRRLQTSGFSSLLVNGLAQHLPYRCEVFDQVVATFPTPYIIEKQTLDEIFRVLVPGGTLVVVPVAWITGTSTLDRLAANTFRILGQSPEWDDINLQAFRDAGLSPTIERRILPSSLVLIITATK